MTPQTFIVEKCVKNQLYQVISYKLTKLNAIILLRRKKNKFIEISHTKEKIYLYFITLPFFRLNLLQI